LKAVGQGGSFCPTYELAIGESTARSYELQNKAVGAQGVTAIEIAKQIASGNVKVTPDFLVQGDGNLGGVFDQTNFRSWQG